MNEAAVDITMTPAGLVKGFLMLTAVGFLAGLAGGVAARAAAPNFLAPAGAVDGGPARSFTVAENPFPAVGR